MASDLNFVQYVADQIQTGGEVAYKKMFGEYQVYLNGKPVVLVCDNTAFVKMLDCVKPLLENAETGFPYPGAKECYVVNPDDSDLLSKVAMVLEKNVPAPKPRKRK
jgi:TfoX/Sxy family transcriptional regulator of competence genes